MTVSQVTLGGKDITKGDVRRRGRRQSYVYVDGEFVYDVETADEALAVAALAGMPAPGRSPAPAASGSPAASCVPPSGSPAPEPSAS